METRSESDIFWQIMLPASMVLAPTFSAIAQIQAPMAGTPAGERLFQTFLFLATAFGFAGVFSLRVLISRAIETHHLARIVVLTLVWLGSSFALISYGISTLGIAG